MSNIPTRLNNPGDLKSSSGQGGFQSFSSPQEGFNALKNDLNIKISGQSKTGLTPQSTLKDFAYKWAPPSDNNDSESYANNLAKKLGVSTETPIGSLKGRVDDFANAIADNEGYQGIRVAGTSVSAKSEPELTDNFQTKNTIPQLNHSQLIANVNAMESQGAKPEEIQNYLDGLKSKQSLQKPQQQHSGQSGYAAITPTDLSNISPDVLAGGTPQSPQEQTLGQQIGQRGSDLANAVGSIIGGEKTGSSRLSGVIQGAGALAGGIGDVIGKGLDLIPGVKQIEGIIGQGVNSFAQTPAGQSVMKSMQDFSTAHPELSKDIGAGFNIVTAIPILKGFGLVKNAVLDGASIALKKSAQDIAVKDLTKVVADSTTGKSFLTQNADAIKTLIKNNIIPTVENGKWSIAEATQSLADAIKADPSKYTELTKAGDVLQHIDGKEYKPGILGEAIKHSATVAGFGIGETLSGGSTGGLIGGYAGRQTGKFAEKKLGDITTGLLKRSAQAGTKLTKQELKTKLPGLFGGTVVHKLSKT